MPEYRRILLDGAALQVVRHGDTLVAADGREVGVDDAVHLPQRPSRRRRQLHRGLPRRQRRRAARLPRHRRRLDAGVTGGDTLAPVGPGLVTDWDFHGKTIRTLVNDAVVQEDSTEGMGWDMHSLDADIARTSTLSPGDLLVSGTPANSRPVQPGDVVEVEVDGPGRLTNHIVVGPTPIRTDVGAQPTEGDVVARPRSVETGSSAGSARPRRTSTPPPSLRRSHPHEPQGHRRLGRLPGPRAVRDLRT